MKSTKNLLFKLMMRPLTVMSILQPPKFGATDWGVFAYMWHICQSLVQIEFKLYVVNFLLSSKNRCLERSQMHSCRLKVGTEVTVIYWGCTGLWKQRIQLFLCQTVITILWFRWKSSKTKIAVSLMKKFSPFLGYSGKNLADSITVRGT